MHPPESSSDVPVPAAMPATEVDSPTMISLIVELPSCHTAVVNGLPPNSDGEPVERAIHSAHAECRAHAAAVTGLS